MTGKMRYCPVCGGEGYGSTMDYPCATCGGTGRVVGKPLPKQGGPYVVKIVAAVGRVVHADANPVGHYVAEYDPDAFDGRGHVRGVQNPAKAQHFHSASAAMAYITQVSKVRPVREDGAPNRPLTAFTCLVMPLEG